MDLYNSKAYSRRRFMHNGVTLASACVTVPAFIQRSAWSMTQQLASATGVSSVAGVPQDRVLVVVQLAGGNDGLNTIVPFADDPYYRARPRIAIPAKDVLKIGNREPVGLHPGLIGLNELYDEGILSIVQGTGYPNPNRSHFTSMDIWNTAKHSGKGDGWLGRYFDNECAGTPDGCDQAAAVSIGEETPLALIGDSYNPVNFEKKQLFQWSIGRRDAAAREAYRQIIDQTNDQSDAHNPTAEFLTRTAMDAQVVSKKMRDAVGERPLVTYPRTDLARQLAMVGSMIRAGMSTRVYYVSMGGFDTHAGQGGGNGRHANLLRQFGDAMLAFAKDLKAQGNDTRVLTMCFSEFGRRVEQNASNGTDHGTAAPMFLMGPMVKPGLLGRHPSLTDLDQGDLKFSTDFRSVYATVLAKWLKADDRAVLGRHFKHANVLRRV